MWEKRVADKNASYWIEELRLEPHPEGGFFRQTYRSEMMLAEAALPAGFRGARAASTAIYFLMEQGSFSAFHRLRSDEVWHFYTGDALAVHVIEESGKYWRILLGHDTEAGQVFQAVVKSGCWFASEVAGRGSFGLVGCTVAPGFEFEDFEMAERAELANKYPIQRQLIERLTRVERR